ncbi:hypothetical protein [Parachlamydia acanthamoebae]|uniref:hypothetical protein n=1 Tax=Parachlamydia acanthamoebae TaxID=83552 RepID=UPI0024E1ACD3|nr:hypothetical protein [Parachlamydia acanthamoebae]
MTHSLHSNHSSEWNFYNHYIFFPKDSPTPEERKKNLKKSVLLGIFTFGLLHAGCGIYCGLKKLQGRTSPLQSSSASDVNKVARRSFKRISAESLKNLHPKDIQKMTPDEHGFLMDNYSSTATPHRMTQAQLNGIRIIKDSGKIKRINEQGLGLGHCGRYCINNAMQADALLQDRFLELIKDAYMTKLGSSEEDAQSFVDAQGDIDVDIGILRHILENGFTQSVKDSVINELPGIENSKQQAMENYIGNDAKWVIIANIGFTDYHMPSPPGVNATYSLTRGHLVALRKDDEGQWWYIDSRAPKPYCISLAVIPHTCTLIVPT